MRVIVTNSYDEMSTEAAKIVAGQIYLKPDSVLGLATGSTPLSMYKKLIAVHEMIGLDFSQVTTFNFFDFINIKPENIYIPDGMAKDIVAEGKRYDALIEAKGGIDLQILGIGQNAHIGFNEPDIKFEATTHKVRLDEETIQANSRFFQTEEEVPRYAISMGIKTIMLAKKVVLLANGHNKAEAIYNTVCGSISPSAPASILQLHRDATVIVDKEAASLLPDQVCDKICG